MLNRLLQLLGGLVCLVRGHAWRGGAGCRPWCARCGAVGAMPALAPDVGDELLALHHGAEVRAGVIARLEADYAEMKREAARAECECARLCAELETAQARMAELQRERDEADALDLFKTAATERAEKAEAAHAEAVALLAEIEYPADSVGEGDLRINYDIHRRIKALVEKRRAVLAKAGGA